MMNLSLSSLLVVVVVATLTEAAPRSPYGGGSGGMSGWPWLPGYHPSFYSSPSLFPSSSDDFLGSYGDYPESSMRKTMAEDFHRRVMEAQRRCHDDFMLLRRLLEEQNNPLRGPSLDVPWYFPVFRYPYMPEGGLESESEEEENDKKKRKSPKPEVVDETEEEYSDEYVDLEESSDGDAIESVFLDSPTPGPEWQIIPLLPEVPDADDLPDKYDNSTHKIHIINGSRVEVNTTTHKDSGDVVTTFFHTEVINILPEEPEPEPEPEPERDTEDTTGQPEGELTTDDEETETEDPSKNIETHSESPGLSVPADLKELIEEMNPKTETNSINNSIEKERPSREFTEQPSTSTTGPQAQHLAAYVKGAAKKGKEDKDSPARPRDLSGDTLVNKLSSDKKGGNKKEPDAEYIRTKELQ